MIVVLGDIHFRDDKPYWVETCNKFLDWFKNYDKNNRNNTLLLAGDLVEDKLLSGQVVDFLDRFLKYSNFKEIHICVGNHDKKEYHNKYQLAYEFYRNYPHVHIYEEAQEVSIEGLRTLVLPYYLGVNEEGLSMKDYYSNIYLNDKFLGEYGLVLGHFCDERFTAFGGSDCVSNLDKINADKIILGHIHTRGVGEETTYIGSVFAGKKNENDYRRCAMVFDGKSWTEDRLPLFNEFLSVTYPEELPKTKALVPIYTILNCSSESVASSKYGDVYIRRVTTDFMDSPLRKASDMDEDFSSIKQLDPKEIFFALKDNQEVPWEPEVVDLCIKVLGF